MSVSPSRLSLSSPSEAAAVALALGGFTARPSKYTPKKYLRNSPLFASLASSSATKKNTPKRKRDSPTELDALSSSSAEAPLSPTLSASSGDADSSVTLSDLEAAEFLVTFKRQCSSPTNSTHSGSSAAEESPSRRAKAPSPLEWSLDARPSLSPSASLSSVSSVSVEFAVPNQYSSARGQLLRFQQVASRMYQRKLDQLGAPPASPAPASPADSDSDMASTDSIAEGL